MEYRVEELASQAGVAVDTVRYYQARGLIEPPRREGRRAIYGEDHVAQLARVRELASQGFKLAQIQRLTAERPGDEALLGALVEERVGGRTFSRDELAHEAGVPEAFIAAAESAGLIEALTIEGEPRFSEADLQMARAGMGLLAAGLPVAQLLELAQRHAQNVEGVVEEAIDLFNESIRKTTRSEHASPDHVSEAFRSLLPQVTRLVALHFQRTLVSRALDRLADSAGDRELESLRDALTVSGGRQLSVDVEWR